MAETAENHRLNASGPLIADHLEIPENLLKSWQIIVDLITQIAGARAGLIMRAYDGQIEVMFAGGPNNPYKVGEKETLANSGLYCEKVMKENEKLLVPNALKSNEWKNNPDIRRGLLSYLGFPIRMPDNTPFGTICILDDKENKFSTAIEILIGEMRDLIEAHLKLLFQNSCDQLTGLFNRVFFNQKAEEEMKRAERCRRPVSLLMLDLDHFKQVNDAFGHLKGDEVLKNAAHAIVSFLRGVDIVARYGGEEFLVLLPDTPIGKALDAAERIRAMVENSSLLPYGTLTVSIGAAEYRSGETFDEWFSRADAAVYQAKNIGRNQVVAFDTEGSFPAASVHLEWKSDWNSGSGQIDGEHREMLELGNKLINMSLAGMEYDKISEQLKLLLNHILFHFDSEEKLLSRLSYPDYEKHCGLHKDLVSKALGLKEAYTKRILKQSAFFSFIFDEVIVGHLELEDTKFFSHIRSYPENV